MGRKIRVNSEYHRTRGDSQPRSRVEVSGWKITKRKLQGQGGFWLKLLDRIFAEDRPGRQGINGGG